MGRKLGFTSLFRIGDTTTTTTTTTNAATTKPFSSSWAWPSCKQEPRTDSFRAVDNAVYSVESADSLFTHSSAEDNKSESFSSDDSEDVIRGLAGSDRLFVEAGRGGTSSILDEAKGSDEAAGAVPFKESVAMAMESRDPYVDFKKSMEEMVVAHGMKDWERLEELLVWYLKANGKKTHGHIVGAFVDLLVGLAAAASAAAAAGDDDDNDDDRDDHPCSSSCCGSSLSMSTSRNCYEIEEVDEEEEDSTSL